MFATYSYLGHSNTPVGRGKPTGARAYGAGTTVCRILGGQLILHDRLEKRIATFTGSRRCDCL